jgi:hypothetical protein
MTKRLRGFRRNRSTPPIDQPFHIDWSTYGRVKPRQRVDVEVVYTGDGSRTWCVAKFPIERFDEVKERIQTQIDYWKGEPK